MENGSGVLITEGMLLKLNREGAAATVDKLLQGCSNVVRSVTLQRRERDCVCGSCWFSCLLLLFLLPHTSFLKGEQCLVTLLPDLGFTLCHPFSFTPFLLLTHTE